MKTSLSTLRAHFSSIPGRVESLHSNAEKQSSELSALLHDIHFIRSHSRVDATQLRSSLPQPPPTGLRRYRSPARADNEAEQPVKKKALAARINTQKLPKSATRKSKLTRNHCSPKVLFLCQWKWETWWKAKIREDPSCNYARRVCSYARMLECFFSIWAKNRNRISTR